MGGLRFEWGVFEVQLSTSCGRRRDSVAAWRDNDEDCSGGELVVYFCLVAILCVMCQPLTLHVAPPPAVEDL